MLPILGTFKQTSPSLCFLSRMVELLLGPTSKDDCVVITFDVFQINGQLLLGAPGKPIVPLI